MGINYPGGTDHYTTPSDPEDIPLSSAGDGTRNLVESVRDLGAAVTALEELACLKNHIHANGGDGTPTLTQSHTHDSPDTDVARTSIHHTLGTLPHQAAAGDHTHTYDEIINTPFRICTSLTRPPTPFLGLHIWEADTNRWRVWGQFSTHDIAHPGVYYTDFFERHDDTGMGADWEQHYYPIDATLNPDGTAGGLMSIPDGHNVQWDFDYLPYYGGGGKDDMNWPPDETWPWPYIQGRCLARNVNTVAQHTLGDDQSLTWIAGPTVMPLNQPWPPNPSSNDLYLRMSDDRQSYVRVIQTFTPGQFFVFYIVIYILVTPPPPPSSGGETIAVYATKTGIANEQLIGTLVRPHTDPWSTFQVDFIGWTMSFYTNSTFVGRITDHALTSAKGSSNRGWGIGMTVGRDTTWTVTKVSHPTLMNSVTMRDVVYYSGEPIWQLLPVGSVPVVRLRQGHPQQIDHAGSLLEWSVEDEDNFGFFTKTNSSTDIHIGEQGLYEVDVTVQMGTDFYPDEGTVVVIVNGEPTEVRQQAATPGYGSGSKGQNAKSGVLSITIPVHGKLRLTAGDILQVQCYYTCAQSKWDLIVSYSDPPSNVMSTFKLKYLAP